MRDRAVIVLKTDEKRSRLNFIGSETPLFYFSPISFVLVINDIILINFSFVGLCDRRLGVPYAQVRGLTKDGQIIATVAAGLNRTIRPVLPYFPHPWGTGIYQAVFGQLLTS